MVKITLKRRFIYQIWLAWLCMLFRVGVENIVVINENMVQNGHVDSQYRIGIELVLEKIE